MLLLGRLLVVTVKEGRRRSLPRLLWLVSYVHVLLCLLELYSA